MKSFALRAALFGVALSAAPALAADHVNLVQGIALRGYDPVAYFTQGKAVRGDPKITAKFDGATYDFVDEKDRAAFEADPAKYAPQYGGFCAAATTHGRKVDADPHKFVVKDGKLYVNYNQEALDFFAKDLPTNITAADRKWPEVKEIEQVIR